MRESEIKSTEDLSEWIQSTLSRTRVGSQSTAGPRSAFSAGAVQVARPSQSAGVPTGIATRPPIWTTGAQNTRSPAESLPTINGARSTTCHWRTCLTADLESRRAASHHLRGRFRQAARCALEARHDALIAGDRIAESLAWMLFCLLPFWKPVGHGRVEVGAWPLVRHVPRGEVEGAIRRRDHRSGPRKFHTPPNRGTQLGTESPSCAAEHEHLIADTFDLLLNSLARARSCRNLGCDECGALQLGTTFRRVVGSTLAKQFSKHCKRVFRFSTRCPLEQALIAWDTCSALSQTQIPRQLNVDGIRAYDHVLRAAMLGRLVNMEEARAILPSVRMSNAIPSSYQWFNDDGECRRMETQAEGGEQETLYSCFHWHSRSVGGSGHVSPANSCAHSWTIC